MPGEISYDLIFEDDMEFVEGTFRVNGGQWQVLIVSRSDVAEPVASRQNWESGVSGLVMRFPRRWRLDHAAVEQSLATELGVTEWARVRGPDSMQLR